MMYATYQSLLLDARTLTALRAGGDGWTLTDHLLAVVVDCLQAGNWQRAGRKNSPKPKPVSPLAKKNQTRIGNTAGQSTEEVLAKLAKMRPVREGD